MSRCVIVVGFVEEFSRVAQDDKGVGKPFGDPELPLVIGRKEFPHPLAEGFAAFAQVHSHVKHLAMKYPHQFALRLVQLVVQSAEQGFVTEAMVILHEVHIKAGGLVKVLLLEAFKKEASAIAKYFRL